MAEKVVFRTTVEVDPSDLKAVKMIAIAYDQTVKAVVKRLLKFSIPQAHRLFDARALKKNTRAETRVRLNPASTSSMKGKH